MYIRHPKDVLFFMQKITSTLPSNREIYLSNHNYHTPIWGDILHHIKTPTIYNTII